MKKYILLLIAFCTPLFGGNNPRTIKAVCTVTAPSIDGYGNDDAWNSAHTANDFVQRDPQQGTPASYKTEVKVLYDDDNLYFYAMMYDSAPDSIVARLARRDDEVESDYFSIGLDSYNDHQTAYIFTTLPSGSKVDLLNYNDGRDEDFSWDPVWEVKTKILPNGWSAEVKIPLSQIRFTQGNDTWGITFFRKISRIQEINHWALLRKDVDGAASQYGSMTGMADLQFPILFEVLPYGVSSSEHHPQKPDREKVEKIRPDVGLDLKYGVTSNFTLDATFNPDFAQVEADPEVLNLTVQETFYPEKRPFFIEGTQIIRFVTFGGQFGPGLFYSRRIGKAVNARLPGDGLLITDEPHTATILGAAKLSGKTEGGTSLGVLTALTDEEEFTYRDTLNILRTARAEPSASYNLFRVKQDFWGNSNVGAIITATARDRNIPAYTVGTDWDVKLDSNKYRVNGFLALSHGEKFLDRTGTVYATGSMRDGTAGKLNLARISGEHWLYSISYDFTSKKYYINDAGFFLAPNDYGMFGTLTYREQMPGETFRNYSFSLNGHLRWNYDRMTLFKEITLDLNSQFLNYWIFDGGISYSFSAQDPYEPRGFGVFNFPASFFVRAEIESDNRKPIVVNAEENYRSFDNGGSITNSGVSVKVRPTSSMEYLVSFNYATERNLDRFVTTVKDTLISYAAINPIALYGKRDVDGIDITLRSSILFTHELSLQIYNQFFAAKRNFDTLTYGLLNPQRSVTPYAYSVNRDFNQTSLISNVVLRWEYREGSTFYFVWSHGRAFAEFGGYNTSLGTNIDNTFLTKPDNVYAVKISYWMSL